MNIQIFGIKKSFDSKKAERFFKERGIKYQFVDMKEKGLSKGEFNSVCQAVGGYEKLIDQECKDKDLLALITYLAEEDKAEKILENQKMIKTPIVRNGKQATVGYRPDVWKNWKYAYGECEKMTYYNREDQFLRQRLQKEIPILRALIQNLYEELDRKLHLNGAKVPITFGYDTDTLGSYTRRSAHEKEHFHFSLLFIAYGVKNPLSKEDRIDLFKHEYAHYMQYNMQIPEKYKWQAGTHGSAWKYCCSLIGAAPTPYYKAGEALMNHDYDKVLKNRIHDKSVPVRDTYQQLKTAQKKKDEVVQYKLGDAVTHPKFGHGIVEKINQRSGGVHLHIRFDGEVKCIDQKWLSRKKYT